MFTRILSLSLLALLLLSGAVKKNTGSARGENQDLMLAGTIYSDGAAVKELLGDDLGGHFVVVQVTVEPKFGKEITIDRDDFLLRTDKDGDRSKPMAPSQVAGNGGLILTRTQGPGGDGAERSRGWSLGGIGMGGGGGMGAGSGADPNNVKATMETSDKKENPLKKMLDDKVLPEKKIEEPTTGFLFFPMENQKLKDLELQYGGRENKIRMRFK